MKQENPIDKTLDDTVLALETVVKIYVNRLIARLLPIATKVIAALSIWAISLILIAMVIDSLFNSRTEPALWLAVSAAVGLFSSVLILKFGLKKRPSLPTTKSVPKINPQHRGGHTALNELKSPDYAR